MTATPFAAGPRVLTSDGVGIATYDLGGVGPPLLLAHATGFHGRVWLPVAAALAERYHCWSFDSRGHGDSDPAPGGDYDWQGFGRDVLAVVAAISSRRSVWDRGADAGAGASGAGAGGTGPMRAVGHSAGGAALLLAEEAEPGTFSALYLYEPVVPVSDGGPAPAPDPAPPHDNPLAAGARRRREVFASREAALENYAGKPPFTTFDPGALEAYVRWGFHDLADGTVELACRRENEARVYEAVWYHHASEHLDRVACPVTLASGGAKAHFGVEVNTILAGRIAGPTSVEVHEDLGHFGPMERPAEIAAFILAAFHRP